MFIPNRRWDKILKYHIIFIIILNYKYIFEIIFDLAHGKWHLLVPALLHIKHFKALII